MRALCDMRDLGLIHAGVPMMLLSSNLAKYPDAARQLRDELRRRQLPELLLYGWDEPPVTDEARWDTWERPGCYTQTRFTNIPMKSCGRLFLSFFLLKTATRSS